MSTPEDPQREAELARGFANRPQQVGRILVLAGCALLFVTSFFTPDPTLREVGRIGGAALLLLGLLAWGFGALIAARYRSPRDGR